MSTRVAMTNQRLALGIVVGCVALLLPSVVHAQSAIAGLVTDATGAVLPGVTVEAASPALIEGARSAVSDGQGRYTVDNLRPGVYKATFTLAGFSTTVREGIELVANFTAPVNAQMRVGAVEESITVSGATPLVDVQRTSSQQVLTREVLDSLPTGRNAWCVGITLPGITANLSPGGTGATGADVGGLGGTQQQYLSMHGSQTSDSHFEIDGMNVTCVSTSSQCVYLDDGAFQELNYQTVGGTAESQLSGVIVNMIPKDGGNTFKGTGLALYSNNSLYSSNYSPELKQRGLLDPGALEQIWDYNTSLGGPVKKDKLWFFASLRIWGTDKLIPNTFNEPGVTPQPQYSYPSYLRSYLGRLTAQANHNNRIALFYAWMPRDRPRLQNSGGSFSPGVAANALLQAYNLSPYVAVAKWTSTLSSRMLVEAGWSINKDHYHTYYADTTAPGTIMKQDTLLATQWNAGLGDTKTLLGPYEHITGQWSYVTGSQAVKAGIEYSWGRSGSISTINGDLYEQYRNGVPFQVQVFNTPVSPLNKLKNGTGIFLQDAWTINRFTINGGIRYDYMAQEIPAQSAPAGTFVPERNFAAVPLPTWHNWSPRIGVAYDVFGDGRTALKASYGKYILQDAISLASKYNPLTSQSDLRTWTIVDPTGQLDIGPPPLSTIGPSTNRSFGLAAGATKPDPDLERGTNVLYNASVQHQLFSRVSVSAGFYHRSYSNLVWTNNLATTFDDHTLIQISNPYSTGETVPVYNLSPAKLGLVQNLDQNSTQNTNVYNGYDASVNVRFGQGRNLLAGMASGLSRTKTCQHADPNRLQYCDQTQYDIPWNTQFKLAGSYTIPWGISVGAVIQSSPGLMRTISYLVTRAQVPTLTVSSVTEPLNAPGTLYYPRLNLLDLKFSKTIKYRATRIQPQLALFNITNAATVLSQNNNFGPSLDLVQSVVDGRFIRFGVQVDF